MKSAYTYTVLRYVHDVAREEFLNVGVALYSQDKHFGKFICLSSLGRMEKVFRGFDAKSVESVLNLIRLKFSIIPYQAFPVSVMDIAWSVLPKDDSSLQWSSPGSGITDDLSKTAEDLYKKLVED